MVRSVEVPYVSVWDVDVVAQPSQIVKAVELLRQGTDFVYPYEKYFLDTSAVLRREYLKHGDLKVLQDYWRFMTEMYPPNPGGGAFLANRESYIRSGLENENFYGWGIEDGERFARWKNMGFTIERIEGPIFHLSHPRGINSAIPHPVFSVAKHREYLKSIRKK